MNELKIRDLFAADPFEDAFRNFLGARKVINSREFQTQTELRLGNPKTDELPVLAFDVVGPGKERQQGQTLSRMQAFMEVLNSRRMKAGG